MGNLSIKEFIDYNIYSQEACNEELKLEEELKDKELEKLQKKLEKSLKLEKKLELLFKSIENNNSK